MASTCGRISFWANSSAVCAMSRCCSVKSAGVKTSSGERESRRKLPPGTRRSIGVVLDILGPIFHHEGHEGTRRKAEVRIKIMLQEQANHFHPVPLTNRLIPSFK